VVSQLNHHSNGVIHAIRMQKRIFVLYAKNLLMEKENIPNVILVIKRLDLTTNQSEVVAFSHK
jgi:hypothetical protein